MKYKILLLSNTYVYKVRHSFFFQQQHIATDGLKGADVKIWLSSIMPAVKNIGRNSVFSL